LTTEKEGKKISMRTFNDWRAYTIDLLAKSFRDDQTKDTLTGSEVKTAGIQVMDVVWPWSPPQEQDMLDSLCEIFTEAVQFSQFLRRQRAFWSVRFPMAPLLPQSTAENPERELLVFDPAYMVFKNDYYDDVEIDPKKLKGLPVEMVVTPALYKRGNMDGEFFDREYMTSPAWVVVNVNVK
jgi:hypothetical protein